MGRLARATARAPWAILAATVVLVGLAGVAASNLDTTFSQEEFIPEDSEAARLIDRMDELFGGDVTEQTFVLVDADLTDPTVVEGMLEVQRGLVDVDDVRVVEGRAEASSPPGIFRDLENAADRLRAQLRAQFAVLADPAGAADDLPLPGELSGADLPSGLLDPDEAEDSWEEALAEEFPGGRGELEERLPEGVDLGEALLRMISPAELEDAIREVYVDQLADAVPDGVDEATLEALADLDAEELTLARMAELGYPLDELGEDTRELLGVAEELAALGWTGDGLADDADLVGLYDLATDHAPAEIAQTLPPDRTSGLMLVGTTAGEEGAEALAATLGEAVAPLREVGAEVLVASEPLLIDETLEALTDAQLWAIVISLGAAAALLITHYTITARRPVLGLITMTPSLVAVVLVLGSMWLVGLAFNALTATIAAIAIGIGVPYGIHISNRFVEERLRARDSLEAIQGTISRTGAALVGSAVTTASAFGVLSLSELAPLRQFGGITAVMIVYALLAAVLVQAAALVLWDRFHRRASTPEPARRHPTPAEPALAGPGPVTATGGDGDGHPGPRSEISRMLVAALVLAAAAAALTVARAELQLEPLWAVLVGAALALMPVGGLPLRVGGLLLGIAVAWVGYLLRVVWLPDTLTGAVVATLVGVAALAALAAAARRGVLLWAGLTGAAVYLAAYDPRFTAAPERFLEESLATGASLLFAAAVGLVAAVAAQMLLGRRAGSGGTSAPSVRRSPAPPVTDGDGRGGPRLPHPPQRGSQERSR